MRGLVVVALLVALFGAACAQLIVKKETLGSRNGVYGVRVSYKKQGASSVTDVKIKDTLPDSLELVSGKLSVSGPAPTKEFQHNDYYVRPVDLEFSLANRTFEIALPAATVTFLREDGSEGTSRTVSVPLVVTGPTIPEGEIEAPWLIFALTIVFPLLAAVFTIKTIAQRGRGSAVPKASKKRN